MNNTTFTYEPLELHRDARGLLVEPLDQALLHHQNNTHLVITEPGAIRGNHYHKRGTEVTVILGPALVRVRTADRIQDVVVPSDQACRFVFPPGVAHAFQNNGTRSMVLIAFNTIVHDPTQPDVVREILIDQ
jgi:dTDP-4-dehydrorhamnose 3,5-epimerase-like enzyme